MSKIIVLDKSIADKIAAGEVVERPASVVKELVENSLDAGATDVRINIESGGQDLIEIIDNGTGMSREDVETAIRRFATSKISQWEDLEGLHTFGFRGEALPSIAAVSKLDIYSRERGKDAGVHLRAEGGDIIELEEAGTPQGTRIRVADLFFNTPARRKFLKSASGETAHIVSITQKLSLVNEQVAFQLTSNGREIFHFPATMSAKERILKIWGLPLNYDIIPLEHESLSVRVTGFICKPDRVKTQRSYQHFFVNGRYIKNQMISQALMEGFEPLLPSGKFPMALLFIDVVGGDVDINVHPNKMEVRFVYPGGIFKTVRDAVKKELRNFGYSPASSNGKGKGEEPVIGEIVSPEMLAEVSAQSVPSSEDLTSGYSEEILKEADSYTIIDRKPLASRGSGPSQKDSIREFTVNREFGGNLERRDLKAENKKVVNRYLSTYGELPLTHHPEPPRAFAAVPQVVFPVKPDKVQAFTALAQMRKTYILGMVGDELWIVDQHTAHERINYEKLHRIGADMALKSQQLLFPVMLELPVTLFNFLVDKEEEFESLGFEVEPFGGNSILIKAIPFGFDKLEKEDVLLSILEEVAGEQPYRNLETLIDRIRSTVACKASVKAGDVLTLDEMNSLVNEMISMEYSSFCPHGRPVVVKLSKEHMDKMFHRI